MNHPVVIETTDQISVELVQKMGGDAMIVAAARVSVIGIEAVETPEATQGHFGLISYLMKQRHGSPFEHGAMTFRVHAPLFVWREWHRHRVGFSYNEQSARYSQLKPVFWLPKPERKMIPVEGFKPARPVFQEPTNGQYSWVCSCLKNVYEHAYTSYQSMIDEGIAKEVARAVLPVGIYSACYVTCNPRSLMHFLSLRVHEPTARFVSFPQEEIQQAARVAEEILRAGWPITHSAFIDNGRVAP